ncbi:MAG: hypothetical protein WBZ39_07415 [Methylovirgula sp.]
MLRPRKWKPLLPLGILILVCAGIFAWSFVPDNYASNDARGTHQPEKESTQDVAAKFVARYTKILAGFTAVLALVAGYQIYFLSRTDETARISAEAAKLSAEALIDAERAHLYVIITESNLKEALQAAVMWPNSPSMDSGLVSSQPTVAFVMKNLGRTPAILKEISYHLIQGADGQSTWDYGLQVIANPVIDGGAQSDAPIVCGIEAPFSVGDSRQALSGERPLYFYGHFAFATAFRRHYVCYWRFENERSRRWVLARYEQYEREEN